MNGSVVAMFFNVAHGVSFYKRSTVIFKKHQRRIDELEVEAGRYKAVLASHYRSTAFVELGLDGTILDANDLFCATMGYARHELIGSKHARLCLNSHANSGDYGRFWMRLCAGEHFSGEFRRLNKAGQSLWLEASYNSVLDADSHVVKVVKLATDVTDNVEKANSAMRVISGRLAKQS